ncbi:MAG: hypothetical protein K0S08_126 [Gammaproteobacteria bacterium]|jgi:hypothetical protein|nr:hypothetical protein [Gammaproteobacteria bacterium]MCE3239420.1 hypothetical protein [Gammaproteobacteria bacterium]
MKLFLSRYLILTLALLIQCTYAGGGHYCCTGIWLDQSMPNSDPDQTQDVCYYVPSCLAYPDPNDPALPEPALNDVDDLGCGANVLDSEGMTNPALYCRAQLPSGASLSSVD